MTQTFNQNTDTFNTMHKLERAGMSRTQAEITSRAIDQQISLSRQEILDKIDERFDAMNERFDERFNVMNERFDVMNERFIVMNERFDAIEKRLSWLYVESLVAMSVMGVGFGGVIIALLRMG